MKIKMIIAFCLLTNICMAQFLFQSDTLINDHDANKIILIQNRSKSFSTGFNQPSTSSLSYQFKVGNGKIHSTGYFGNGIRKYVESNPQALKELDKFKSKRVTSVVGYAGMFVCLGIGSAIGLNVDTGEKVYDPFEGKMITKKEGNPTGLAFVGLAVVCLIVGGSNYFSAGKHMGNAVQIYNDELDKKALLFNYNINPIFDSNGPMMQFSVSW